MIALGSDHGGFQLKETIKKILLDRNIEYKDYGTYSEDSTDYFSYGEKVGEAITSGECEKGIIVCGTGLGISMAANKVAGIRAAVCTDTYMAKMSREHNNANILSLGARVIGEGLAEDIINIWLDTPFTDQGRHLKRVKGIMAIEEKYSK